MYLSVPKVIKNCVAQQSFHLNRPKAFHELVEWCLGFGCKCVSTSPGSLSPVFAFLSFCFCLVHFQRNLITRSLINLSSSHQNAILSELDIWYLVIYSGPFSLYVKMHILLRANRNQIRRIHGFSIRFCGFQRYINKRQWWSGSHSHSPFSLHHARSSLSYNNFNKT